MYDIIEIIDNYICFEKKLITMRENDIRDEARRKIKLQEQCLNARGYEIINKILK